MKAIAYSLITTSAVLLSPLVRADVSPQTQACVDAFIAEKVPARKVDVRVNDYMPPVPLLLRSEMALELRAVDKQTGRTIAVADCRLRSGEVTIRELPTSQREWIG